MFVKYYIYYFYYTFLGYPFVIRVVTIFLTVFILFFILDLLILGNNHRLYYLKKKFKKNLDDKYFKEFVKIIAKEREKGKERDKKDVKDINDIKEQLAGLNIKKLNVRNKQLLTNYILYVRKQVENSQQYIFIQENYQLLLEYFELRYFWEKKLKYGRSASRQKALRKIDDLDLIIPGSIISSLTHNWNQYVRKKARVSYMYFSKSEPFKFLNGDFDKTFNSWDKVEIHRMLSRRREKEELPHLTHLVKNSENVDFQCFLIDEIKFFDQRDCIPTLFEILHTPNVRLRRHAIAALGEMCRQENDVHDAESQLITMYSVQPLSIQRSIIAALLKMNSGNVLPFLERAYGRARDHEGKIAVLYAIFNYGDKGRDLFQTMKEKSNGTSQILFEHVSNPLIKFNLYGIS